MKIKDEAKFNVKALVQKEDYQENLKLHLEQERESLLSTTEGSTIVIQELRDFSSELAAITELLENSKNTIAVV